MSLFFALNTIATKNATEPTKSFHSKLELPSVNHETCESWCPSDHNCSSNGVCCLDSMVGCGPNNAEGYCCNAGYQCCDGGCCPL